MCILIIYTALRKNIKVKKEIEVDDEYIKGMLHRTGYYIIHVLAFNEPASY